MTLLFLGQVELPELLRALPTQLLELLLRTHGLNDSIHLVLVLLSPLLVHLHLLLVRLSYQVRCLAWLARGLDCFFRLIL